MKSVWIEFRMFLAEWFLAKAVSVCPNSHPHSTLLLIMVIRYLAETGRPYSHQKEDIDHHYEKPPQDGQF